MSDGILSQDEIDALLGGSDLSNAGDGRDLDIDAVAEVLKVAMEASVERLGEVIGLTGLLTPGAVMRARLADLAEEIEGVRLAVEATLEPEVRGSLLFLFEREAAAAIGAMRRGVEREGAEPDQENIDGFREAFEEVSGELSSALTTILATEIEAKTLDPVEVDLARVEEAEVSLAPDDDVVACEFEFALGEARFGAAVLVPAEVARAMLDMLAGQAAPPAAGDLAGDEPLPVVKSTGRTSREPVVEREPRSVGRESGRPGRVEVREATFADLGGAKGAAESANLSFLLDVPLEITVELGRTHMQIREILELGKGSVVELNKLAGEPVEVFVNGKLIAKGEVVTIDENFGVKITDIVSRRERVTNLRE